METLIRKSDFVLAPYMKSDNLRATWQVIHTVLAYLCLWGVAYRVASISYGLTLLVVPLIVLFSLRCFSLMHDCGHYSLFTSRRVNRIVGFFLGAINAMPQHWWSRDHAYHHKTNGDWERYRGIGDFLSLEEFLRLSPAEQKWYARLRSPWMIFPGGLFYLAFKPRIILVLGAIAVVREALQTWQHYPNLSLRKLLATHQSRYWGSAAEFWDVLLSNIVVVGGWIILCHFLGVFFFLTTYSLVLMLSAACLISIFFVQHNYKQAYAHKTEGWSYLRGAIEGSSYLEMPAILRWFTADISFHSIHHLSEKIPNYHLKACHQANQHLLGAVTTIRLSEIPRCAQFIVWDATNDRLVSIQSALAQTNRLQGMG